MSRSLKARTRCSEASQQVYKGCAADEIAQIEAIALIVAGSCDRSPESLWSRPFLTPLPRLKS